MTPSELEFTDEEMRKFYRAMHDCMDEWVSEDLLMHDDMVHFKAKEILNRILADKLSKCPTTEYADTREEFYMVRKVEK